ncbi:MAG TPA: hypothetical protein VIK91_13905, partial [Nannocystis sp.]
RLGLWLPLVACTIENPAFDLELTAATASSGTTTDTGRTTSGAPTSTSPMSTSGPDATTTAPGTSADVSTGIGVSDTDTTTAPPGTTSTTDWPMTASSDPGTTDAMTTMNPMACGVPLDPTDGLVQLLTDQGSIPASDCKALVPIVGRIDAGADGFWIHKDMSCGANNAPYSFHVEVPLPDKLAANGQCVSVKFDIHEGYQDCVLSVIEVKADNKPVLLGSFGRAEPPGLFPLQPALVPENKCVCPGCCGDAPDPDLYKLKVAGQEIGEKLSATIAVDNDNQFAFTNLRSHVHTPACTEPKLPRPEWLHIDWVAVRTL